MAKPQIETLLGDTVAEVKAMGKQGMDHPSTRPVLVGAGIGTVLGAALPLISWPVGLFVGAAVVLYKRVRP